MESWRLEKSWRKDPIVDRGTSVTEVEKLCSNGPFQQAMDYIEETDEERENRLREISLGLSEEKVDLMIQLLTDKTFHDGDNFWWFPLLKVLKYSSHINESRICNLLRLYNLDRREIEDLPECMEEENFYLSEILLEHVKSSLEPVLAMFEDQINTNFLNKFKEPDITDEAPCFLLYYHFLEEIILTASEELKNRVIQFFTKIITEYNQNHHFTKGIAYSCIVFIIKFKRLDLAPHMRSVYEKLRPGERHTVHELTDDGKFDKFNYYDIFLHYLGLPLDPNDTMIRKCPYCQTRPKVECLAKKMKSTRDKRWEHAGKAVSLYSEQEYDLSIIHINKSLSKQIEEYDELEKIHRENRIKDQYLITLRLLCYYQLRNRKLFLIDLHLLEYPTEFNFLFFEVYKKVTNIEIKNIPSQIELDNFIKETPENKTTTPTKRLGKYKPIKSIDQKLKLQQNITPLYLHKIGFVDKFRNPFYVSCYDRSTGIFFFCPGSFEGSFELVCLEIFKKRVIKTLWAPYKDKGGRVNDDVMLRSISANGDFIALCYDYKYFAVYNWKKEEIVQRVFDVDILMVCPRIMKLFLNSKNGRPILAIRHPRRIDLVEFSSRKDHEKVDLMKRRIERRVGKMECRDESIFVGSD